jgi:hypothetical protein
MFVIELTNKVDLVEIDAQMAAHATHGSRNYALARPRQSQRPN